MNYSNIRLKLRLVFLSIFLLMFPVAKSAGKTYYVAATGTDNSSGIISSPLRSLRYAVRVARAGDTIVMRGGVYQMREVLIDRRKGQGGRPGAYLTIKAYPGEKPVLRRGNRRLIIHADYVRVEGLHFIMPWTCDAFGQGLQIVNNNFTGQQPKFAAIRTGGHNILVEGNLIRFTAKGRNTRDHGIYVHRGRQITIRNNKIIGTQGYGIHIYDEHKSVNRADWAAHPFAIKDILIEGNFVAHSKMRSGIIIAKGRGGRFIRLENITVRNNVIRNNADYGLMIREGKQIKVYNNTFFANRIASVLIRKPSKHNIQPASDIEFVNNIFVSQQHVVNNSSGQNIVLKNNLYNRKPNLIGLNDEYALTGAPLFFNVSANDFHLLKDSPAIDSGANVGLLFIGTGPDIGAFEFEGNASDGEDVKSGGAN